MTQNYIGRLQVCIRSAFLVANVQHFSRICLGRCRPFAHVICQHFISSGTTWKQQIIRARAITDFLQVNRPKDRLTDICESAFVRHTRM